jgi:GTP-binding protein Era
MRKTLIAAITGRANTGKSTLMNTLLGVKISIVSNKPQTTRNNIRGILTKGDIQYIFLDTPGLHKPKDKLGSYMMRSANSALAENLDVIIYVVSAGDRIGPVEESIIKRFSEMEVPVILIVNKTDINDGKTVGETILQFSQKFDFASVIPLSAKTGKGTEIVFEEIDTYAIEEELPFPEVFVTHSSERNLASEMIREKILVLTSEEVPHGVAVSIESFEEKEDLISIRAEIFCERASHKPIIIGKNGETLKKIGTMAREDMEKLFGVKVYLDLWVKVKENWRANEIAVANMGYKEDKE